MSKAEKPSELEAMVAERKRMEAVMERFEAMQNATRTAAVAPGDLQPVIVAPSEKLVRLDLACGQSPREGFDGVDIRGDKAKYKVDLFKFPWPFEDASVDKAHCSHFIEHLPAREVELRDLHTLPVDADARRTFEMRYVGKDFFFAFFDELWRILKPDANALIICPALRSNRAFQDPTHRRFIPMESFMYLWKDFRVANKLDHYLVNCNFGCNIIHTCPEELTLLSNEAQQRRFNNEWNTILDWHVTMKKLAP
jgi:hypothetical protein